MSRTVRWVNLGFVLLVILLPAGMGNGGAGKEAPAPDLTAVGRGTLRGTVVLEGDRPDLDRLDAAIRRQMENHKDAAHCLQGSKEEVGQQTWLIDAKGGVANVFVWLQPAEGEQFRLDKSDLELKEVKPGEVNIKAKEVVLDQPYCAFVPHAFVLFPSYFDAESRELKPTGQKLVIKNSAKFVHNTKREGSPGKNRAVDVTLPAGQTVAVEPALKPDDMVTFQCNIHPWMRAYARAFDHPFATVTRKDGSYEIKNAPAGMEASVVAWHEAAGYLTGPEGQRIRLKEGDNNVKDFKMRAK